MRPSDMNEHILRHSSTLSIKIVLNPCVQYNSISPLAYVLYSLLLAVYHEGGFFICSRKGGPLLPCATTIFSSAKLSSSSAFLSSCIE